MLHADTGARTVARDGRRVSGGERGAGGLSVRARPVAEGPRARAACSAHELLNAGRPASWLQRDVMSEERPRKCNYFFIHI